MPPPTRPTVRRRYTQEDVSKALEEIKKGMSLGTAARTYGVPKTTLSDKVRGRTKEVSTIGRPSVLTQEEEEILVRWVIRIGKMGFPLSKQQLLHSVARLIQESNRANPFTQNLPGDKWYGLFLKRHPIIAERAAQALTTSRANVTEGNIRRWFEEVRTYFEEKGLMNIFNNPSRVFNADETAFFLCPKGKRVLAKRGEKAVFTVSGNDDKECLTVLVNGNAAGELAPSMVVYAYERVPALIGQTFPQDWALSKSETGWMTCATFYEYITNVFYPWLVKNNTPLPVVLFIDGHSSHLSLQLSDFCSEKGIEVIALYPNSTHLLQPMDVAVFRPLKAGWKKGVDEFRFKNGGRKMKKEEFAPLLKQVIDSTLTKKTISNGFEATGLNTLNPDKVHYGNLTQNPEVKSSLEFLINRRRELVNCLQYLEVKIGLEKVQRFHQGDVLLRDESLHEVWQSVRKDINAMNEDIAKKQDTNRHHRPENLPPANESLLAEPAGSSRSSRIDEPVPIDEIEGDEYEFHHQVCVLENQEDTDLHNLVVAEATSEGDIILDPAFLDISIDNGMVVDIYTNEDPAHSSPLSHTSSTPATFHTPSKPDGPTFATSTTAALTTPSTPAPSTSAAFLTPSRPTEPFFPQPGPSSSSNLLTSIPSPSTFSPSQLFPITPTTTSETPVTFHHNLPSPFKRCLIFPTPPNGKKKRLTEVIPSTVTGQNFKDYMRKKEEQKIEKEKERERKRILREEKKKTKDAKSTKKRLTFSNDKDDEDDVDDPDSPEPEEITEEELKDLSVNSWVVVPYEVEGKKQFFPGQIKQIKEDDTVTIKYLEKKGNKFIWPEEPDVDEEVPLTEIVQKLSAPQVERRGLFSFKEKIMY